MRYTLIIPIYNAEKTLVQTLTSVTNQYRSFDEVFLVNNNSTDNSQKIIATYCQQYQYFTCIFEQQQGVAAARNAGLKQATGTYIFFLDCDDILMPNFLERMAETITGTYPQADLYQFNFSQNYANGQVVKNKYILPAGMYQGDIFFEKNIQYFGAEMKHMVWSFAFKKTFLDQGKLYFDERFTIFEDIDFLQRVFLQIPTISVGHDILIQYQYHATSLTNRAIYDFMGVQQLFMVWRHTNNQNQLNYFELLAIKVLPLKQYLSVTALPRRRALLKYLTTRMIDLTKRLKQKLLTLGG